MSIRRKAPPTPLDHPDPVDYQAINEYLRGVECRRLVLARPLDESRHWQACGVADEKCDMCKEKAMKEETMAEYGSQLGPDEAAQMLEEQAKEDGSD